MPGGQTGFGHKEKTGCSAVGGVVPFPQCSYIPAHQLADSTGHESWWGLVICGSTGLGMSTHAGSPPPLTAQQALIESASLPASADFLCPVLD